MQVRAARFFDLSEFIGFFTERLRELIQVANELAEQPQAGDAHRRRHRVVGGLRLIDVIVRIDARIIAASGSEQFQSAVGQHFVDVHVVRRARAGLKSVELELIVEAPGDPFAGGRRMGFAAPPCEPAGLDVGVGGGLLDFGEGHGQRRIYSQSADPEIVERAFGLDAVKRIGGHTRFAQRITFHAEMLFGSVHIKSAGPSTSMPESPERSRGIPAVSLLNRSFAPVSSLTLSRSKSTSDYPDDQAAIASDRSRLCADRRAIGRRVWIPHGLSHSSAGLYRPCPPLSTCKAKREYGTDGKGRSKRKMTWSWHEYFRLYRFFRLFRTCSSPPISLHF